MQWFSLALSTETFCRCRLNFERIRQEAENSAWMSARQWSQNIWPVGPTHRHSAGVPFFVITPGNLSPAKYFQDSSGAFVRLSPGLQALLSTGWLVLFRKLLSLPATPARRIVDEPVSCHFIPRLRHFTVIAPVGFAGREQPVEMPLFNYLSPSGTMFAVVCPTPIHFDNAEILGLLWFINGTGPLQQSKHNSAYNGQGRFHIIGDHEDKIVLLTFQAF